MPIGPGKYDDACTAARESTDAAAVILIVLDGRHGSGFSVQANLATTFALPQILRRAADDIERTNAALDTP